MNAVLRDTISEIEFEQVFLNDSGFAVTEAEYVFPIEFWSVISRVRFQVGTHEEIVTRVVTKEEAMKHCMQDISEGGAHHTHYSESAHDIL